jgi:CubicO group peptidase (beta-lactamase class C family)
LGVFFEEKLHDAYRQAGTGVLDCCRSLRVQALTGFAQTSADASLADALTKLDAYAKDAMATTKVPGVSVAVVYQDQVVFLRGYGVREKGKPGRVDPDTVFEIASFSKAIASTVVAAVVGRGEVSWDSRIQDLRPAG